MADSTSNTLEQFEPLTEGGAKLLWEGQEWPVVLKELEFLPVHQPSPDRPPFTFLIEVQQGGLEQATYALQHDSLEQPISLFLVPIAGDGNRTTFQAIFN